MVLSIDQHAVSNVTSLPPFGKSDHTVIGFEFVCYRSSNCMNVPKYLYGHADYESMTHKLLNINCTHLFKGQGIDYSICDWICKEGSYMRNYKYLEIQF